MSDKEAVRLPQFDDLVRDANVGEGFVQELAGLLATVQVEGGKNWWEWFKAEWQRESQTDADLAYPSQGLVRTGYEPKAIEEAEVVALETEVFERTIHAWLYYLAAFNHPERLRALGMVDRGEFKPPKRVVFNPIFFMAKLLNQVVAIEDLGLHVVGAQRQRTSRSERFKEGPFVKLGRQARSIFVGSANPDIWSVPGIASMAQCHCLVGIPRDGKFNQIERQADMARAVFEWIDNSPVKFWVDGKIWEKLRQMYRHNVMGILEADPEKAAKRLRALYGVGVRTFRIYSPEPGTGPVETLKLMRRLEQAEGWEPIEIFVGQVVSAKQARDLEKAGADGIYVGIAGGGRCTTGVRSGAVVDWPQLVWEMVRGGLRPWRLKIPVIVEGGASDHIAQTLALGATGIAVSRMVGGGTIEAPGGYLFLRGKDGSMFLPYGGEASARTKALGGRVGPFGVVPYIEGETTWAVMNYGRGDVPTMLQRLFFLYGDVILALVFQNVESIEEFQDKAVAHLRKTTPGEIKMRNTH